MAKSLACTEEDFDMKQELRWVPSYGWQGQRWELWLGETCLGKVICWSFNKRKCEYEMFLDAEDNICVCSSLRDAARKLLVAVSKWISP